MIVLRRKAYYVYGFSCGKLSLFCLVRYIYVNIEIFLYIRWEFLISRWNNNVKQELANLAFPLKSQSICSLKGTILKRLTPHRRRAVYTTESYTRRTQFRLKAVFYFFKTAFACLSSRSNYGFATKI